MIYPRFEDAICFLVIATLIARAEPRSVSAKPHAFGKHWRPYFSTAADDRSASAAHQTQLYAFNQPAKLKQQMDARVTEAAPSTEADAKATHTSQITHDGNTVENDLRLRRLMEELVLKSRLVDRTEILDGSLPKDYSATAMTRHSNGGTETVAEKQSVVKEVESEGESQVLTEQLKERVVDSTVSEQFRNEALENEQRRKSVAENQVSQPEAQHLQWAEREVLNLYGDQRDGQRENSSYANVTELKNCYNNTNNSTHGNQNNRLVNQFEVSEINENENRTTTLALGVSSNELATNLQKQRFTETQSNVSNVVLPDKDNLIESIVKSAEHQTASWPLETSIDRPVAVLSTVSNASNSIRQAVSGFPASTGTAAKVNVFGLPTKSAGFINKIFNYKCTSIDDSNKSPCQPNVDSHSTTADDMKTSNNKLNSVSLSGLSNKNYMNFSSGHINTQHNLLLHNNSVALSSDAFIFEPNDSLSSVQTLAANTSLRLPATQAGDTNSSAVHNGEIAASAAGCAEINEDTETEAMAAYECEEASAVEEEREQSANAADTAESSKSTETSACGAHRPAPTTANNVAATNLTLEHTTTTTNEPAVATSPSYRYGDESVEYVEAAIANFLRSEIASSVDTEADRTREEQSFAAISNVPATAAKRPEFHRTNVIKSAAAEENDAAAPVTLGEEVRSTVNCFTGATTASVSASAVDNENHAGITGTRGAWSITSGAEAEQPKAGDKNTSDDPQQRQQLGWAPAAGELQWTTRAAAYEREDADADNDDDGPTSDYPYNDRTKAAAMPTIEKQSTAILEKDNGTTYGTRAHMADAPHMKGQHNAEDAEDIAGHHNRERNELQAYLTVGESAETGDRAEEDVDADDDDDDDDDGDYVGDEAIHIMSHLYGMDKTIEGDKLPLEPVDDAMKIETESTQSAHEEGKVPAVATASPHHAAVAHTNANGADITTTNWWRTLSYAEIRIFLNTIFDSAAHELYAEIARKSKEIQSGEKEVDAWLSADASATINDFWSFW